MSEDEKKLDDEIYNWEFPLPKVLLVGVFLTFLGVFLNFSFKDVLRSQVISALKKVPCPISYESFYISYLFPKIVFNKVQGLENCIGFPLNLDKLHVGLKFPGIFPPGIKVGGSVNLDGKWINATVLRSLSKTTLRIDEEKIPFDLVEQLTKFVTGHITLKSVANLENNKMSGNLLIKSKDLVTRNLNLQGIEIPQLPLKNVLIKAKISNKVIKIIDLVVGNDKSPIIGKFKGTISIMPRNPSQSSMKLTGKLKLSESFENQFSIIGLLLGKMRQDDGSYALKIEGPVGRPKFYPL